MVDRSNCFSILTNKSYKIKKTRGHIYISNDTINMATICTYRKNNVYVSLAIVVFIKTLDKLIKKPWIMLRIHSNSNNPICSILSNNKWNDSK